MILAERISRDDIIVYSQIDVSLENLHKLGERVHGIAE